LTMNVLDISIHGISPESDLGSYARLKKAIHIYSFTSLTAESLKNEMNKSAIKICARLISFHTAIDTMPVEIPRLFFMKRNLD